MRRWHQISHFPLVWDHQSCFMSSFLGNVPSPVTRSSRPKSVAWKVWSESSKVDPIIWRLPMIVLQSALAMRWDDCWVFKMLDCVVIVARDTVDILIDLQRHHCLEVSVAVFRGDYVEDLFGRCKGRPADLWQTFGPVVFQRLEERSTTIG